MSAYVCKSVTESVKQLIIEWGIRLTILEDDLTVN